MKLSSKRIASFFAILPIAILTFSLHAQEENLVENGSFENLEGKLKALGCIDNAKPWMSPTGARADIFTPSKVLDINTPVNIYGKEDAKDGTNYAGIVGFSYGDAIPRTYIMAHLNTPLKKGMKYCVKFNISLAELSKYASNKIGVKFSEKQFGTDSKTSIIEKTDVLDGKDKIFNAVYNWDQVCGTYYAQGGEKFITIGNFTSNENTKSEKIKKDPKVKAAQVSAAYYYIDNITVSLISDDFVCDCGGAPEDVSYSKMIYQKVANTNSLMSAKEQIELQNSYFGFGGAKLTPDAIASLDLIANLMKENASLKLEIFGHADEMEEKLAIDKPEFVDMSSKRISAIMKYLMSKGIAESILIATPVANSEPAEGTEDDEEEFKNAKNRFVSYKVR
jgi:outer membrane protein OmpA-like peptidoglycan-associated protein